MERQTFKTMIDAPRERVWDILWNDATYREWTSVFSEGSRAESDWKEGSKILFLDGKGSGMVSRIAAKRPPEFMSFEHLGEVHNGVEDLDSEKVSEWSGSMENYTLRDVKGKTELTVEIDLTDDFKDYFLETWPKALENLRSIVERSKQGAVVNPS
jgi:uncharacterized protein YndB with AHSA1/START domain